MKKHRATGFIVKSLVEKDYPELHEFYLTRNREQGKSLKEILHKCELTLLGKKNNE